MQVIRKINNNVAICLDSKGKELVAFGNGIGFPKVPYELQDLNKITNTFYRLNEHYYKLLEEIPENIFSITSEIVNLARQHLGYNINPNLIFTLADHINFSIERINEYRTAKFPLAYDVMQLYPAETKVSKIAVDLINSRFHIKLPKYELSAITMHLIDSKENFEENVLPNSNDKLIKQIILIIESTFNIEIDQDSFSFNRFAMHMRYYFHRLDSNQPQESDNIEELLNTLKKEDPKIYSCSKKITNYVDTKLNQSSTDDETFYVAIYIKRIITHTQKLRRNKGYADF